MGLFDFRKNKNVTSENGLNKKYYDGGKSDQIHTIFTKINNQIHGIYKEYYENGILKLESNYNNGKGDGKFISYHKNGSLFREKFYNKDGVAETIKEFYSNGNLRLEINIVNNHHIFYTKSGIKKFEAYFEYFPRRGHISYGNNPYHQPDRYVSHVFSTRSLYAYAVPKGKWTSFDDNSKKEFELDFAYLDKYGYPIEFIRKNNFDENNKIVSTHFFEVTSFYFNKINGDSFYDRINKKKDGILIDEYDTEIELINDIFKIKPLTLNETILKPFIKSLKDPIIYSFTYENCAKKLLYNKMMLSGGIDSFELILEEEEKSVINEKTYTDIIKQVWESDKLKITYEKKEGVYKYKKPYKNLEDYIYYNNFHIFDPPKEFNPKIHCEEHEQDWVVTIEEKSNISMEKLTNQKDQSKGNEKVKLSDLNLEDIKAKLDKIKGKI